LPDVLYFNLGSSIKSFSFYLANLTVGRQYTLPDASGTLLLTYGGTGTLNYIPKFTAASTLGDSIFLQESTNTLKIIAASAALRLSGSTEYILQTVDSDARFRILDQTNSVERFTINTSGSSIFLSNATATLKVHSSTNSSPQADIELMRGTNTTWGADVYADYRFRNLAGELLIQYGDSGVTSTRMTVAASGNILIGTPTDNTLAKLQIAGNLSLNTAGNKLLITTGTNASVGSNVLVAGTVTVSTTAVTANSIILLTAQSGTITGSLKISARTSGTSFTILSTVLTDTANVGWLIIN
jgi:hypothetical protein